MRLFFTIFVLICLIVLGYIFLFSSQPKVSVIMATWNRKDMAREAIESILNQTYRNFEFIIVDDASTDGTADLVQEYADKDNRIIFIRNTENKGLVYNLNLGLKLARGKYIARMDDDDIAFPERFEKQVAFLEETPKTTALGTLISPIGSTKPYDIQHTTDPEIFKVALYLGYVEVSHPSLMIRRDFLNKHSIRYSEEYKYAEDRPFYAAILDAGGQIHALPEVLLHYRFRQSVKPKSYIEIQHKNTILFHTKLFKKFNPDITSQEFEKMDACDRLFYIQKENPKKKLVNPDALNTILRQCIPEE